MSTSKSTPEQLQELVRLVAKTPARRRYVLLRRASGELAFVQLSRLTCLARGLPARVPKKQTTSHIQRSKR